MFEELVAALEQGKIVAIARDDQGGIRFEGAYDNDAEAALRFSANGPEEFASLPTVVFIKGQYSLNPPAHL